MNIIDTPALQQAVALFRNRIQHLERLLREKQIEFRVCSFYRSFEEQDRLFSYGRSRKGRIVTYAKAGESPHNYYLAQDYVLRVAGVPVWNTKLEPWPTFINLVRSVGLKSGADFKKIHDACHVELSNWRTVAKKARQACQS